MGPQAFAGFRRFSHRPVRQTGSTDPALHPSPVSPRPSFALFFSDDASDATLRLPQLMLQEHEALTLHSDLLDCHVDICSPEVVAPPF